MLLGGVEVNIGDAERNEAAVVYRRCLETLGIDWNVAREENLVLLERFKKMAWT